MRLNEATPEIILSKAKELCLEAGQDWDSISEEQQNEWEIEASFCFSWLCE